MNLTIQPKYRGSDIDASQTAFGELRPSGDAVSDMKELRRRFERDGYLLLPGLLDRDQVVEARLEMLRRLDAAGCLDPDYPLADGVAHADFENSFMTELAQDNAPLMKVLYDGPMMAFYRQFLGGEVRHFDYTWCRSKPPGDDTATPPHYDIVFMGRGTRRLYTSWTPLGDIPVEMGGLMVLENSHRLEEVKGEYGTLDVDAYCTNYPDAAEIESGEKLWQHANGGAYSLDPIAARAELGLRWLTTDYEMGDLLIFSMYTMHASMDNQTKRIRLSTDTRYQLASEPVDERWIGENPIAHGLESKRGMIC